MAVKLKKLYEGKAKIIYAKTSKEVIATYKNDATAFNNLKKGSIKNKGAINNAISSYLFQILNHCDIPTHFIKKIDILRSTFYSIGINLVDFKLEFGICKKTDELVLADEISPDTCRLWDLKTNKKLDKDRFRRDLGNIEEAYEEVLNRLNLTI